MTKNELFSLKPLKIDTDILNDVQGKWDSIQKPIDGLGDFEKITSRILAINKVKSIDKLKKVLVVMCADHGIVEEGVSQSGQEVTLSVAKVLGEGISTASRMAAYAGVDVIPVDVGINSVEELPGVRNYKVKHGTNNFLVNPAMTVDEVIIAVQNGIKIAHECKMSGYNMLATGEMGIGNTTSGTTVLAALTGICVDDVIGRGAGLSDEGLLRKKRVIEAALEKYDFKCNTAIYDGDVISIDGSDSTSSNVKEYTLDVMSKVGGLELAAMTGLFIGGAVYGIPVMIDGVLSAVSALCAEYIMPGCRDFMIPSHSGREKGTSYILSRLKLRPILNGDMALGEGTGALMAIPLLDMAFDFYKNALTFENGNVEQYVRM